MNQSRRRKRKERRGPWIRILAGILVVLLAFTALVIASSLVKADRLMKVASDPIPPYATNMLPSFQTVSFKTESSQLTLRGWMIAPKEGLNRGTVILVHDQGKNRLPFGPDSNPLIKLLSREGFYILAFDQRHSGDSDGGMSSFGYAEADDVLAALRYASSNNPKQPLLLYGFGTGNLAIFRALEMLDKESGEDPEAARVLEQIGALLTDSPARSSESYIRAAIRQEGKHWMFWLEETTPYAIRLSISRSENKDYFTSFSSMPLPVLIFGHEEDSQLLAADYKPMITERLRLMPERTLTYILPGQGHLTSYQDGREGYLEALEGFLERFFPLAG